MANYNVIVDATFLRERNRTEFCRIANNLGIPFIILDLHAPVDTLRERIIKRIKSGDDASDAGLSVLDYQIATQEPLDDDELQNTITIDTEYKIDLSLLLKKVEEKISCEHK